MPNYYTFVQFGVRVLRSLPEPLARLLEGERTAFDIGCCALILCFLQAREGQPRPPAGAGNAQGAGSAHGGGYCWRWRRTGPRPRGYAAGFLCHFALDSACHAYIEERSAVGPATHSGMEASSTACLWSAAGGVDPLRETPHARRRAARFAAGDHRVGIPPA